MSEVRLSPPGARTFPGALRPDCILRPSPSHPVDHANQAAKNALDLSKNITAFSGLVIFVQPNIKSSFAVSQGALDVTLLVVEKAHQAHASLQLVVHVQ